MGLMYPFAGSPLLVRPRATERVLFMWRAFFTAVGIVVLVLGLECMVIDEAILANRDAVAQQARVQTASLFGGSTSASAYQGTRIFRPSEWLPWGLVASGAVACLYAISYKNP